LPNQCATASCRKKTPVQCPPAFCPVCQPPFVCRIDWGTGTTCTKTSCALPPPPTNQCPPTVQCPVCPIGNVCVIDPPVGNQCARARCGVQPQPNCPPGVPRCPVCPIGQVPFINLGLSHPRPNTIRMRKNSLCNSTRLIKSSLLD
jgi:hypothetical protein